MLAVNEAPEPALLTCSVIVEDCFGDWKLLICIRCWVFARGAVIVGVMKTKQACRVKGICTNSKLCLAVRIHVRLPRNTPPTLASNDVRLTCARVTSAHHDE